eukprot:scaffold48515_cov32-Tisochrysis_lutea.AAC.3
MRLVPSCATSGLNVRGFELEKDRVMVMERASLPSSPAVTPAPAAPADRAATNAAPLKRARALPKTD